MRLVVNGLILVFLFSFPCCTEHARENNVFTDSDGIDTTFHDLNSFGQVHLDTSKFRELRCGLYINSKGIIGYRAIDNSLRMMDSTGKGKAHYVYLTTVWGIDEFDILNGGKEMRYVVDTATFQLLGLYGIDSTHVYDINPMLDGGTIRINRDADVKTFQLVGNEFFAKDKKQCYYRGQIIEEADIASFDVLDISYSPFIAFDKNNYYDGENKMSLEDIKKRNLDAIRRRRNGL